MSRNFRSINNAISRKMLNKPFRAKQVIILIPQQHFILLNYYIHNYSKILYFKLDDNSNDYIGIK